MNVRFVTPHFEKPGKNSTLIMREEKMKKKKSTKREIIEWVVFLGVIVILWATGLHTPVMGFIQGLVLKTGIMQPSIDTESGEMADFNMMLSNKDGELHSLREFKGKVVFINIWATWCPPCIAEMPDIHEFYKEMKDENIAFVMLSVDEDFQKALKFVEKKGYDFPVYRMAGPLPIEFESNSIPTTFVISPEGKIVVKKAGMAKYNTEKFKEQLRAMQKEGLSSLRGEEKRPVISMISQ